MLDLFWNVGKKNNQQQNMMSTLQSKIDKKYNINEQENSQQEVKSRSFNDLIAQKTIKTYSPQEWKQIVLDDDFSNTPRFEVQASLRSGIPNKMRPQIWFWLSSVKKYEESHNENLYEKLTEHINSWKHQIDMDIIRTYQQCEFFQCPDNQKRLFRVLMAYSNYDKEIGYCQGMNFMVANLLLHLHPDKYENHKKAFGVEKMSLEQYEKKVFWILVSINFEKNWREVYKDGLPKVQELVKYLNVKLNKQAPKVFQRLLDFELSITMCFDQVFITILLYYAPLDYSQRIIDVFLCDGHKIIVDILVRMIQICEEIILKFQEIEDLFKFLRQDLVEFCFNNYQNEIKELIPMAQSENSQLNFYKSQSVQK